MKKEEIEVVIKSYLTKARSISNDFGCGNYGNNNFIQQFIDGIDRLTKPKSIIECKLENFNAFINELLEIQKRINELKDSDN